MAIGFGVWRGRRGLGQVHGRRRLVHAAVMRVAVARMALHVHLKCGPLRECFRTDRALDGTLFGVCGFVDGQRSRLAESFAAVGALEWLIL